MRDVCYFVQVLAYFPVVNPCRVGRYTLESIDQQLCTAEVASSSIIPGPTGGGRTRGRCPGNQRLKPSYLQVYTSKDPRDCMVESRCFPDELAGLFARVVGYFSWRDHRPFPMGEHASPAARAGPRPDPSPQPQRRPNSPWRPGPRWV